MESRGLPRDSTCILKAKLVNLISKDMNLVFYLSVNKLVHYFQTKDYDIIVNFHVDSKTLTSFKIFNITLPDKDTCCEIENVYQINVQQCSNYER